METGDPRAREQHLVETDWLAAHLSDPRVRVLDCTVFLYPAASGSGFRRESGRAAWQAGHIPSSGFADFLDDLSDRSSPLPQMMPPSAQFEAAMSRYGVGDGTRVILYDCFKNIWAARLWWMLRAFGFDDAGVLNGGWNKWTAEGRPVSTDADTRAAARFVARPRPALFVGKPEVLEAIGNGAACVVNALSEEQHRGTGGVTYGRPGRIAGSMNVSAQHLVDEHTHGYLGADQLRQRFEAVGALDAKRVITYCGSGIAASSDAFVLTILGHRNVAVYDASLSEWAADPSLPMETG
jgi:thiosulfate/3-mercaptopyruvate sulfurtransferase